MRQIVASGRKVSEGVDGEMLSVGRGYVVEWEVELKGYCALTMMYRSHHQTQSVMVVALWVKHQMMMHQPLSTSLGSHHLVECWKTEWDVCPECSMGRKLKWLGEEWDSCRMLLSGIVHCRMEVNRWERTFHSGHWMM